MTFSEDHSTDTWVDPNKPGRKDKAGYEWWKASSVRWFRYENGELIIRDKYDAPWAE